MHGSHCLGIWKALSIHQIFVEGDQTGADQNVTSSDGYGLCDQFQLVDRQHGAVQRSAATLKLVSLGQHQGRCAWANGLDKQQQGWIITTGSQQENKQPRDTMRNWQNATMSGDFRDSLYLTTPPRNRCHALSGTACLTVARVEWGDPMKAPLRIVWSIYMHNHAYTVIQRSSFTKRQHGPCESLGSPISWRQ